MSCKIRRLKKSELHFIKALWEKLNQVHLSDSIHFKDHYRTFTFENRITKFKDTAAKNLYIELLEDNSHPVGYCISTIHGGKGEIDSLFINEAFRSYGYGKILAKNGIQWMKQKKCSSIQVSVAEGHDNVIKFYEKLNFFPRLTTLVYKNEK